MGPTDLNDSPKFIGLDVQRAMQRARTQEVTRLERGLTFSRQDDLVVIQLGNEERSDLATLCQPRWRVNVGLAEIVGAMLDVGKKLLVHLPVPLGTTEESGNAKTK